MIVRPKLRAGAAAEYLGLSGSTLSKMRLRGDGPPYSKAGPRIVVGAARLRPTRRPERWPSETNGRAVETTARLL